MLGMSSSFHASPFFRWVRDALAIRVETLTFRYIFDSKRTSGENPDVELCRVTPDGGRSCVKVCLGLYFPHTHR